MSVTLFTRFDRWLTMAVYRALVAIAGKLDRAVDHFENDYSFIDPRRIR